MLHRPCRFVLQEVRIQNGLHLVGLHLRGSPQLGWNVNDHDPSGLLSPQAWVRDSIRKKDDGVNITAGMAMPRDN